MSLRVRVIPCLDVKDGRVVKGVQFVSLRDAGDPVELVPATIIRSLCRGLGRNTSDPKRAISNRAVDDAIGRRTLFSLRNLDNGSEGNG